VLGGGPSHAQPTRCQWVEAARLQCALHGSLMIDQYQDTPGSEGLQFHNNPDVPFQLTAFTWGAVLVQ